MQKAVACALFLALSGTVRGGGAEAVTNGPVAPEAFPGGSIPYRPPEKLSEPTAPPARPLPSEALLRLGLPLLEPQGDGSLGVRPRAAAEGGPLALRLGTDQLRKLADFYAGGAEAKRSNGPGRVDVGVKVIADSDVEERLAGIELRLPARFLALTHEQEEEVQRTTIQLKAPW